MPNAERVVAIFTRAAGVQSPTYVLADHLGSPDVLTNSVGAVTERRSFDAFGRRRSPAWGLPYGGGPSGLPISFAGQEDDNLGLIDMKGRMYDPRVGRFLQADPYTPHAHTAQGWNRYSYTRNNPLKRIDPSGFTDLTSGWVQTPDGIDPYDNEDFYDQFDDPSSIYDSDPGPQVCVPPDPLSNNLLDGMSIPNDVAANGTGSTVWGPMGSPGNDPGAYVPDDGAGGAGPIYGVSQYPNNEYNYGSPFVQRIDSIPLPKDRSSEDKCIDSDTGEPMQDCIDSTTAILVESVIVGLARGPGWVWRGLGATFGRAALEDLGAEAEADVVVELSRARNPEAVAHIEEAQAAGKPSVLTIDREGARARRYQSLKGIGSRPGLQRDEYPPAMFKEGGRGASVRHIDPGQNQSAGSLIRHALTGHKNGTRVLLKAVE
ncbi:MAG: RHS repeat-associated core domain-containing protein [Kofleriaceae bacterium]